MRVAVAGGTGRIGAPTVAALGRAGHDVVSLSRSQGVDLTDGRGLDDALAGVDAVVDTTTFEAADPAEVIAFFTAVTGNLLAAGRRAGVTHHVTLSIVGLERTPDNAHYAGKLAQERAVTQGPLPWTIVRATQFHDFAAMAAGWTERDGIAELPPLLVQPVAPADVADVLAGIAAGPPAGRRIELAGPERHDLVDMARRTYAARGRPITLVPTWSGALGIGMAGNVLLPGSDALIAPTTFDAWLAAG